MTVSIEQAFITAMERNFDYFKEQLKLDKPAIKFKDNICITKLNNSFSNVEVLYRPPEFQAEIVRSKNNTFEDMEFVQTILNCKNKRMARIL